MLAIFLAALASVGCDGPIVTPPGTEVAHDFTVDLTDPAHFYDMPFPSDLRLDPDGTPDLRGFPNPRRLAMVESVRAAATARPGFPVIPVAHVRFRGRPARQRPDVVIAASTDSPILLVDLGDDAPARGRLIPTVAVSLPRDGFVPEGVLGVAPRPGSCSTSPQSI